MNQWIEGDPIRQTHVYAVIDMESHLEQPLDIDTRRNRTNLLMAQSTWLGHCYCWASCRNQACLNTLIGPKKQQIKRNVVNVGLSKLFSKANVL